MNKQEREELERAQASAKEYLSKVILAGSTVYTVLTHRSQSGMSRCIKLLIAEKGRVVDISWAVGKLLGLRTNDRHEGCVIGGCGMDMGFHLVYSLSHALWPEGSPCTGDGCHSNDHANGDRNYTVGHIHHDGGYCLRHEWV